MKRTTTPGRLKVENLHYELTETDLTVIFPKHQFCTWILTVVIGSLPENRTRYKLKSAIR